ncbi:hypothetical protein [Dactylosporangium fulvum]|uniref:Uncharacterized protein n=1 Tax=Dactylosporangium fulvum TaxID=53359 RepID=A0ABY5WAA9_9ACTN|nr:hypothetical protein [Dactylosporangium fulvum]UWP86241.1 hypothetical protein Dfulv_19155 [Dactylosporangium fulvum]
MKPGSLKSGDRIATAIGTLIVRGEPISDFVPEDPQWDRIFVDVEVEKPDSFGDPDRLPAVTGASEFQLLGPMPLRYRLGFRPDVDVKATR